MTMLSLPDAPVRRRISEFFLPGPPLDQSACPGPVQRQAASSKAQSVKGTKARGRSGESSAPFEGSYSGAARPAKRARQGSAGLAAGERRRQRSVSMRAPSGTDHPERRTPPGTVPPATIWRIPGGRHRGDADSPFTRLSFRQADLA